MDTDFYSNQAVTDFVKRTLCQGDQKLFGHYKSGNVRKFRERLSRKFGADEQKVLDQALYSSVTDCLSDIILETIGTLTEAMKPAGDLIVSGGESFNMYFERDQRIITSDIDTKFIPVKKGFRNLQAIKLKMWNLLGRLAQKLNLRIRNRLQKLLRPSRIGKFLGVSFPRRGPWVTRRYTLIPKKKKSLTSDQVNPSDVLIDVELFALDLTFNYYSIEKKRVVPMNMGGILDIALMRPGEMGYEVGRDRNQGVVYLNKDTGKPVADRRILYASKRFLVEDLYLMQKLGLRPNKTSKDRQRMYQFSKSILGVKDITPTDGLESIFKKSLRKLPQFQKQIVTRGRKKFRLEALDPFKYSKWTTRPSASKFYQLIGIKTAQGLNVPGYNRTSGPFRFSTVKNKWVLNTNKMYIKNEMTHRPENVERLPKNFRAFNSLYGYRANRNGPETKLLNRAAMIPLVGLKTKNAR